MLAGYGDVGDAGTGDLHKGPMVHLGLSAPRLRCGLREMDPSSTPRQLIGTLRRMRAYAPPLREWSRMP